jgi:hypothetical protein
MQGVLSALLYLVPLISNNYVLSLGKKLEIKLVAKRNNVISHGIHLNLLDKKHPLEQMTDNKIIV